MTPILEFIIAFIGVLLTNGVFFYSINRKLKKAEVYEDYEETFVEMRELCAEQGK